MPGRSLNRYTAGHEKRRPAVEVLFPAAIDLCLVRRYEACQGSGLGGVALERVLQNQSFGLCLTFHSRLKTTILICVLKLKRAKSKAGEP